MTKVEFHKIRVENSVTGVSIREGCIFHSSEHQIHGCSLLKGIECRYSGTNIRIPDNCPLRDGDVTIKVGFIKDYFDRD